MIPRSFRQFDSKIVTGSKRVVDVLKELNDKYIGYRTEGIVYIDNQYRPSYHEIFFSYVENFSWCDGQETEEPEESEDNLYHLYEEGIEPNHSE